MSEEQELRSFIEAVEELVGALTEQVAQKDHQCQVLAERLADQMTLTDELRAQLDQQQAETRKTLILFPKTPAT